jgi:hypothetical protein
MNDGRVAIEVIEVAVARHKGYKTPSRQSTAANKKGKKGHPDSAQRHAIVKLSSSSSPRNKRPETEHSSKQTKKNKMYTRKDNRTIS